MLSRSNPHFDSPSRKFSQLLPLSPHMPQLVAELATQWDTWAKDNKVYPLDARNWNVKIQAS